MVEKKIQCLIFTAKNDIYSLPVSSPGNKRKLQINPPFAPSLKALDQLSKDFKVKSKFRMFSVFSVTWKHSSSLRPAPPQPSGTTSCSQNQPTSQTAQS